MCSSPTSSISWRRNGAVIICPLSANFVLPGSPDLSGLKTSIANIRPSRLLLMPSGTWRGSAMWSSVLQSSSRMITSCATSTSRLVR